MRFKVRWLPQLPASKKLTHTVNLLILYNEQNPRNSFSMKAYSFLASQETPRILWNPKVHYRFHNSMPLFSILG
jgi:hypothetical protein